jgi:glycosyltransferase involved in cell wall biosynthesis
LIETGPYVALESIGCRTAVIGFDTGGIVDLLQSGAHGRLVSAYDTDAMAHELVHLLKNPNEADALGEAGAKWARENCSNKHFCTQMANIYREAKALFEEDAARSGTQGKA